MTNSESELVCREELKYAMEALESGQFDAAASLADPFVDDADADLAFEAKKIAALAHFRKEDYASAVPLFQNLATDSSEAVDWFNVVTSATMAGDVALGEQAFEQACKCQEAADFEQQPSIPFMRLYFAYALRDQGEFAKAFAHLVELRAIYEELNITDDTFVYVRGVPFLSHTLEMAADVLRGLGDAFDAAGWLDAFASKLDDDGKTHVLAVKDQLAGN